MQLLTSSKVWANPCRSDGSRGWIRGATSTLINHLKACPYQSLPVRQKASTSQGKNTAQSVGPYTGLQLPPDPSTSSYFSLDSPQLPGYPSSNSTAGPSNGPGTQDWLSAPQSFQPELSPLMTGSPLLGVVYDSNINSPILGSDSGSALAPSTLSAPMSRRMSRQPSVPIPHLWDSAKQKRFETRIAHLTASAGLPLAWVDNIEFIDLISDFIPGAKPPSRKVLTNCLVPATVNELCSDAKSAASGHEATVQADGWTGQNKHHLIAVMITVKGEASFDFRLYLHFILRISIYSSIQFVFMMLRVRGRWQKTYWHCSKDPS